jgi:hypothetical protein
VQLRPVYIPSSVLALSQKYDFASSIVGDKQYSVIFDNSKIKSVIGDIPLTVPLAKGFRMYLDNVENNPLFKWLKRILILGVTLSLND